MRDAKGPKITADLAAGVPRGDPFVLAERLHFFSHSPFRNGERSVLSEVRNRHLGSFVLQFTHMDIYIPNSQEQGQTPGLPAGVCPYKASSGTSKGQRYAAGTIGGRLFVQVSALEKRGPMSKPKDCSPVCFRAPPSPVIWFSHKHQGLTRVNSLYAHRQWIHGALHTWWKKKRAFGHPFW
jgi:hypothetical protein